MPAARVPRTRRRQPRCGGAGVLLVVFLSPGLVRAGSLTESFQRDVKPLLEAHCYDCHGDGSDKGGVKLDAFDDETALRDPKLWVRVLKNTRAGLMPPASEDPLPAAARRKLDRWIKREALGLDPARPDPGRVTVRRLNRVEYRNTIRDLMGVDYDTGKEFPADDTGHGFDNIADVLTLSPLLLEKYLDAAQAIVSQAVPTRGRVPAEVVIPGRRFVTTRADAAIAPTPTIEGETLELSYYTPAIVTNSLRLAHAGHYQFTLDLRTRERYVDAFDLNRCRVTFRVDGDVLWERDFVREDDKRFELVLEKDLQAGEHELTFEVTPGPVQPQLRALRLRVSSVTVRGPTDQAHWVRPAQYRRFFARDVPTGAAERHRYAREVLGSFGARAFRRPADPETVDKLVAMAEAAAVGTTFEAGIAQAMVAVLASPRFIFREDETEPLRPKQAHPFVDEYTLASRLSYFLWSSMPDAELFRLARHRQLRARLIAQVRRMLADPRADELVRNFTGQWLQARDIPTVPINATDAFLRDHPDPEVDAARATLTRLRAIPRDKRTAADNEAMKAARTIVFAFMSKPKPQLTESLRKAMQQETEMTFAHVLKGDRSALELIDSDYTFLNEELAKHYGIDGVTGPAMRKVTLAADSPRGGVLTQGTVLAVTSNPTRTSPVKRGVFILDAILGAPTPPPPPNIPALEDAAPAEALRKLNLRETLALHATKKLCASCHMRMDPLGLALENFNALGSWRTMDAGQPIAPEGRLVTGETFKDVRGLKRILATVRHRDFYNCLSEKMLTYALGRGAEPADIETVDTLVAKLEASRGRLSALVRGIVESPPFQQRRRPDPSTLADESVPAPSAKGAALP